MLLHKLHFAHKRVNMITWKVKPVLELVDGAGLRHKVVVRLAQIPLEECDRGVIVQGSPVVNSSIDYP